MFVRTVFYGIVEEVFNDKGKEFKIHFYNIVFFDLGRNKPSGIFYHQHIDTCFDKIRHLVGIEMQFKVLGSDLLDLCKLVYQQIETFKNTVKAGFAFFIGKHFTHQSTLGNGCFEFMHDGTKEELA